MAEQALWRKVARTGVFTPFIAVTWLGSGIVVNVVQLLLFLTVYPFSRGLYTKANAAVVRQWYLLPLWLLECWADCDLQIYGDEQTLAHWGRKENVLITPNHNGNIDWLLGYYMAERHGTLGGCRSYMKGVTKYLPILGWSWWFADYVFLDRSWNKDKSTLRKTFKNINSYPDDFCFWMALFAEGTRQTPAKLKESQEWCKANGKPVLNNVLWPRTKGFASSIIGMEKLDCVYNISFCCPDENRFPSFGGLLRAEAPIMRLLITCVPVKEMEKDEAVLRDLCSDLYIKTDKAISSCLEKGTFAGDGTFIPVAKTSAPRIAMWVWTTLIQGAIGYTLLTTSSRFLFCAIPLIYLVLGLLLAFMINFAEVKKTTKTE